MLNQLKQLVIGTPMEDAARRAFARLTPGNRNRQYDIQTLDVMNRVLRRDSNCVDVGCHMGAMLAEMLKRSPTGQHVAFEPIPSMFQRLEQIYGDRTNVHLSGVALSDCEGTAAFQHVISNPGYSGLRRRTYDRPDETVEEISVNLVRLDDVVSIEFRVHFIKIDVEGAELQVLRGAQETIRTHRPTLVFEHGLGGFDAYGTTPDQVYELLVDQCGLRMFLMKDWLRGRPPMGRAAFVQRVMSGEDYYFMACA